MGGQLLSVWAQEDVTEANIAMLKIFDFDEVGRLTNYVGCKIDVGAGSLKLTQPMLLQSFEDKLGARCDIGWATPAPAGEILMPAGNGTLVSKEEEQQYRSGVGKLLHLKK